MEALEKRRSSTHGFGLFSTVPIKKGTVIVDWISTSKIISKDEYKPNTQTAIRLAGDLYLDGDIGDTDFINHSDVPNAVFLLGLVIALRDIESDEEIFLDYSVLNDFLEFDVVAGDKSDVAIRKQAKLLKLILTGAE